MSIGHVPSQSSHVALVLPGAVARGAYEAGVIEVLAEQNLYFDRIVATSSGALNGLAYAVGIRRGNEKEMAAKLTQTWVEKGGWESSFSLNPFNLLSGGGLSNNSGLLKMMREIIGPEKNSLKRPIELQIIVTPLNGVASEIGTRPATSYEQIVKFCDTDFDTEEGLEEIFNVVTAACAFPGLFQPVEIEGLGFCVDGGVVNNAPIRYALEGSKTNKVIMPVPFPSVMNPGDWKNGVNLLNHLIAILINERLYRDLKIAHMVNDQSDLLDKMVSQGVISEDQRELIKTQFSLHKLDIVQIRPSEILKSSPFSGFFHRKDRIKLIEAGRKAAKDTLRISL